MTKQRVAFLDYAKAIGIILVVLGHVINTQGNILPSGKIVLQYIYSFHMPLFFIISGIIIGNKINKYTPSEDKSNNSQKKGKKVGVAYELENGEIIYVPE